jgi:hypothetical protein
MCDEDELRLEVLNHLPLVSRQNPLRSAGLWAGDTLVGALQESLDMYEAVWDEVGADLRGYREQVDRYVASRTAGNLAELKMRAFAVRDAVRVIALAFDEVRVCFERWRRVAGVGVEGVQEVVFLLSAGEVLLRRCESEIRKVMELRPQRGCGGMRQR